MKLIAGLGNPGSRYRNTRHNAGFAAVERAAEKLNAGFAREKYRALLAETEWNGERLMFMKPMTYMNLSGESIARAVRYNNLELGNLLVVLDDVNLELGRLRLRPAGTAGGHNGLKSIIDHLGTDEFPRLRIGIGQSRGAVLRDHVLSTFAPDEKPAAENAVARAADAALCFIEFGIEKAMNEFNTGAEPDGGAG
ncbi:MAG: aminoacyl-tRNA hydrolase [Candidatus Hydrogenedentes bacterium]|nr:aminoacyl-tRNA hydrolase [Candidatus Hydrogenedentota bacterium]